MEDSHPAIPERSALDELRAIQLQFMPKHLQESMGVQSDPAGSSTGGGRGHDVPPTPVSPSDIINSVEQDGLESLEQAQIQPVSDPAAWGQEPGPVLFADPLNPRLGSTVAVEPNAISLATTTQAHSAIDPTSDVTMAFTAAVLNSGLGSGLENNHVPATITPSALLAPTASSVVPETSFHQDADLGAATGSTEKLQVHDTDMQDGDEFGVLPSEDTAANEYIIALPPPSRSRSETFEILNKTHRQEIESFTTLFTHDGYRSPDSKVVTKIDLMLQYLTEMSNLPPYHKDLSVLSQEQWTRYARDTCSKLAFLYEFLNRLRTVTVEITILAAGGPIMEKVEAIVNQGGFTYRHVSQPDWVKAPSDQVSACKVVLIDTSRAKPKLCSTENIVIAYDETADTSGLLRPYKTDRLEDQVPLIFSLIEVYSLEHINRRLSQTLDTLEKKLAQVRCLVALSQYADDEGAYEYVPQPHEVAGELVKYLVDENSFQPIGLRWDTWEHQRIPDDVFNTYKVFRSQLASYGARKRTRQDSGEDTETPKRPRVQSPTENVQLSDALKARFGNDIQVKEGMAQVSIEKLEDLVDLIIDLKVQLDKKGEQVQGYAKFVRRFQPRYQEAIGDRGSFEAQRDKAVKEKDRVQKDLDRIQTRVAKLTEEKQELEARLQELAKSDNLSLAAAAQREVDLKASQDKAVALERQIKTIREDLNFAQSRYQDASDKAAALGEENSGLKLRIQDLEVRASDNIVQIRKINAKRIDGQLRQMYDQEKAMRQDREREIDRKNEELRNYKARFGGRETRGSSVPRSPRIRQMSSRNTSPVGDNGGGNGGGNGGPASGVFGPRGSHLRDL